METYNAKVLVRLKPVVLDPQGKTVLSALKNLGFDEVRDARVGKVIELEIEGGSEEAVRKQIREMCSKLLANPVIEDYEIELNGERER